MKRIEAETVEEKGGEPYRVRTLTLEAGGYSDEVLLAALADVIRRLTRYDVTTNTVKVYAKRRPKKKIRRASGGRASETIRRERRARP